MQCKWSDKIDMFFSTISMMIDSGNTTYVGSVVLRGVCGRLVDFFSNMDDFRLIELNKTHLIPI